MGCRSYLKPRSHHREREPHSGSLELGHRGRESSFPGALSPAVFLSTEETPPALAKHSPGFRRAQSKFHSPPPYVQTQVQGWTPAWLILTPNTAKDHCGSTLGPLLPLSCFGSPVSLHTSATYNFHSRRRALHDTHFTGVLCR